MRTAAGLTAALAAMLPLVLLGAAPASAAGPCGPPVTSVIACENSKPGDPPSDWQVNGAGDSTIQGYATSMGVNVGQTISFKIKTPASAYHIDILRLGYYGGDGARKIASNLKPTATLPQTQPACLTTSSTGLIDCGNWSVSASWTVPSDAVSGVYIAHLIRDDTGGSSQIPFVVRDDSSHSDILLSTSDATWQAYNAYGGNSLYTCTVACPPGNPLAYKGAYAVSYNRPWDGSSSTDAGQSYLYYAEYQMVRFLEKNGYDVSYTTSSDVDRAGSLLLNHKIFMSTCSRRVLVGRPTSERDGSTRCRSEPRLLQRQRGVLEDTLGREPRRREHALSHAHYLQGNPFQRTYGPSGPDHLDGCLG